MKEPHLVFVYNADSDLFSTVTDFAHKLLSPSTYACQLCALTYGHFSEKQEWKTFVQQLPVKAVFLHKDEFTRQFGLDTPLPAVFLQKDHALEVILDKPALEHCSSLEDLKRAVSHQLKTYA
ncbi:hypothetical protein [Rufibacter hautae]|uniref:GTPase n=1 Tax=Rufibacter hautae TaxID=2595005 RepID=A0A5B6T9Q7_9BACT|nr:hypothetical protein [Rufibacter hautae]KAA3436928.1 hypothetical protein FOA19_21370 [Rufibacter hautae]